MGPAATPGAAAAVESEAVSVVDIEKERSVDNIIYVCPTKACGKRYESISSLRTHYKEMHSQSNPDEQKPFKCNIETCSAAYGNRDSLKRHVKDVHQAIPKEFRCTFDGCFSSFDKKPNLLRHFSAAHKCVFFEETKTKNELPCAVCDEIFLNKSELNSHVAQMHGFKCEKCDKVCSTEPQLRRHMAYHRGLEARDKVFECKKCKVTLNSWNEFNVHRKTEEHRANSVAEYKCETCGLQCSTKGNIDRHKQTHEELRNNYHCPNDGCERYYFYESSLRVHLENCRFSELKVRHLCDLCGSILSTKQKLRQHQAKMHDPNKKPEKPKRKKKRRWALVERVIASLSRPRPPPFERPQRKRKVAEKPVKPKFVPTPEQKAEIRANIQAELAEYQARQKPRPSYAKRSKFTYSNNPLLASKQRIGKRKEFRAAISDTYIPLQSSSSIPNSDSVTLPDFVIPDGFLRSVENEEPLPLPPVEEEVIEQPAGIVIDLMHIC